MTAGGTHKCRALARILAVAATSALLASCTSGGVPPLELAIASVGEQAASDSGDNAFTTGEVTVPGTVAAAAAASDNPVKPDIQEEPAVETAAKPAEEKPTEVESAGNAPAASETEAASAPEPVVAVEVDSKAEQSTQIVEAVPLPEKKRGFLSSLWTPKPSVEIPVKKTADRGVVFASAAPAPSAKKEPAARMVRSSLGGDALPGVRGNDNLFEIKHKSGLDDDSNVDVNENDGSYRVASAAGLARLAPNGLLTQREGVDVACLKPSLVRVLKKVERHYGRRVMVTSGYRSPAYNRKARGARNSLHMYCAAADIQVEGVSKWDLARYLRTMPGRGGVGTYCHTKSVHVDVGPERDWNWRCRRRKRRA